MDTSSIMDISTINKHFRIVYQEKRPAGEPRARHLVGAGRLHLYIGDHNAQSCIAKAWESAGDKITFKFRKYGQIIFYAK